jgi:prohibitin 1
METTKNKSTMGIIIAVTLAVLVIIILFNITKSIPAGQSGVLFRPFSGGVVRDQVYGEGFHLILPWNKITTYDVRQQEKSEKMTILSSNGLEIQTDVSVWYRPSVQKLGFLHAEIGQDYDQKVVIPSVRSATRIVFGRYTPEEIYSTKRESIQKEIGHEIKMMLDKKFVELDQVLIRDVNLPLTIKTAIESKLKQEQESLEYEFRLTKASKEAQRQRIEAEGKAEANRIISASLTDKILEEKGIDATLKVAESPNSKVVIIGGNKNGLPIILGQ